MSEPDYSALRRVLDLAYDQAASGKGKERHGSGDDFTAQPIMMITKMVGLGFPAGQAQKKLQEACKMAQQGKISAAQREMLGAIVYCAAVCVALDAEGSPEGSEGSLKDH